jgi:hypothetical protein
VKFQYLPLKGGKIDGMQSEKILDIEKIECCLFGNGKINTTWMILEYIPIVVFI